MRNFLLGVIIGLLVAPKKGSELREDIKEGVVNTYNGIKDMDADDFKEKVNDVKQSIQDFDFNKAKEAVSQTAGQVKDKADEFLASEPVQNTIHTVKEKSSQIVDKASEFKSRVVKKDGVVDKLANDIESDLKSEHDPFMVKHSE